jgi:hypothetical protein
MSDVLGLSRLCSQSATAIGLKQRPETSEIEEFRSAFRLLDWEEERRIAKRTAVMLKRFENDQTVAPAEKEFNEAQEIEAAFRVLATSDRKPPLSCFAR